MKAIYPINFAFQEYGFSHEEAQRWIAAGAWYGPLAARLRDSGFTPETVDEAQEVDYGIQDSLFWLDVGVCDWSLMAALADLGLTPRIVASANKRDAVVEKGDQK